MAAENAAIVDKPHTRPRDILGVLIAWAFGKKREEEVEDEETVSEGARS